MSSQKNRTRVVGIFTVPPLVSKEDFQRGFGEMMEAVLAQPEAKKHVLKYEVSYSNTQLDGLLGTMTPLVKSPAVILLIIETETPEGMQAFLEDAGVLEAAKKAQSPPVGIASHTFSFAADVVTKISK
ncbi:hypothetical protein DFH06DRAFT_1309106 [Mycena polygramma]|nr:hypothetical protein DFH06DRAFT_1309106 [Mycena polygramma]